jgi:membrane AbrB-like protein
VAVYVATYLIGSAGLVGASLFAALIVGIAYALLGNVSMRAPRALLVGSQAVIGVGAGSLLGQAALGDLVTDWVPFLLFSVVTIAMSVAFGFALARFTSLDPLTASFGMMGGGAQGIVAISEDLGADERLVATMQYLRIVVIVATVPLVAAVAFNTSDGTGHSTLGQSARGLPADLLLVAGTATAGLLLARLARLPTGSLLGPMVVAGAIAVSADSLRPAVPHALQQAALAGIGLSVGLRFTGQSLRRAGRLLPAILGAIVAMILICGVVGALLAPLAHVSQLAGYLATSPGGLSVAVGIGVTTDDGPFVISLQVARLFLVLLAAPFLARALAQRTRPSRRLDEV